MKQIKLNGIDYVIESDSYDGDILLLTQDEYHHDIIIIGGYIELRDNATDELAYPDKVTGDLEVDQDAVQSHIDEHLMDYIQKEFEKENYNVTV